MTKCKHCKKEVNVTCICGYCYDCINCYGHDKLHLMEIKEKETKQYPIENLELKQGCITY